MSYWRRRDFEVDLNDNRTSFLEKVLIFVMAGSFVIGAISDIVLLVHFLGG